MVTLHGDECRSDLNVKCGNVGYGSLTPFAYIPERCKQEKGQDGAELKHFGAPQ